MSGFRNPYDSNNDLSVGCSCGRHPNQHEHAAAADPVAPSSNPEILSQRCVESSLVRALFPHDATRRGFIKAVGVNTLPRNRSRHTIHKDPLYCPIRNHLIDFLVTRSKGFTEQPPIDYDPQHPPLIVPGVGKTAEITELLVPPRAPAKPVVVSIRN